MEKSDPQLREDVRQLSARVRELQDELARKNAKPARVEIETRRVVSEITRDNPAHIDEIKRLKATIAKLQAREPDVVEKIVTRTVEVPVERIVTRTVEVPVEKIVTRTVTVDVPVEKIVDRVIEVPVTVEKIVRVPEYRDRPETIASLEKAQKAIAKLQSKPEKVITRTIEKPVDRVIEVEKIVTLERTVQDPLQGAEIHRLRGIIAGLQGRPMETKDVIVRVPVPDPALVAENAALRAEISILKRGGGE